MPVYISMLRGINVVGHNMIKMSELKGLYESLGFTDVATYIQSGNVVFKAKETNPSPVRTKIMDGIAKMFGFSVTVIIRQPKELAAIVKKNPFPGRRGVDETKLHVTFLESKPAAALVKALGPLTAKSKDEYRVTGREIYLYCPGSYGKTLLSNTFFEKSLKVAATTRNWNTVNVLCSLAGGKTE
jgi:uncharacterized protein (DUF1697 family)